MYQKLQLINARYIHYTIMQTDIKLTLARDEVGNPQTKTMIIGHVTKGN